VKGGTGGKRCRQRGRGPPPGKESGASRLSKVRKGEEEGACERAEKGRKMYFS